MIMDRVAIQKLADILSIYSYKLDATIKMLIEKKVFSKEDFNSILSKVMELSKEEEDTDEYVIEELKKKAFLE